MIFISHASFSLLPTIHMVENPSHRNECFQKKFLAGRRYETMKKCEERVFQHVNASWVVERCVDLASPIFNLIMIFPLVSIKEKEIKTLISLIFSRSFHSLCFIHFYWTQIWGLNSELQQLYSLCIFASQCDKSNISINVRIWGKMIVFHFPFALIQLCFKCCVFQTIYLKSKVF